jgi:hypothetical protein
MAKVKNGVGREEAHEAIKRRQWTYARAAENDIFAGPLPILRAGRQGELPEPAR